MMLANTVRKIFFPRWYKHLGPVFSPSLALPDTCNAAMKIGAPAALLDHEATLKLEEVAKDGGVETYRKLGTLVMEATTPALNSNSGLVFHVVQLFVTVAKIANKNNLEKKQFIMSYSFRDLAHGRLTPLFWAKGEEELYDQRVWWREAVPLMAAKKQRGQREGDSGKMNPSRVYS